MPVRVECVENRVIDEFTTNTLVLARKSYYPFWDGQGESPSNTGTVSIVGGSTSMSWYLYGVENVSDGLMVTKHLNVDGKDVQDVDIKTELINAGWITESDNVIIT